MYSAYKAFYCYINGYLILILFACNWGHISLLGPYGKDELFNQSYKVQITPLAINGLRGGHTYIHIHMKMISRNQVPGLTDKSLVQPVG